METIIYIIRIIAIILTVSSSLLLTYLISGVLSIELPTVSKKLDRKPFNCRPCLTFWLTWLLISINAVAIQSLVLFIIGFSAALIAFYMVYKSDQKKIID